MDTKGGRCSIEINGSTYSARAKATIMPSRVSRENGVNLDGTGYSTIKPALAGIDLTFDRGLGIVWDEALMLTELNVTFVEDDLGVTHLFTGAAFEGATSLDTETGEVSGLSIRTDKYQVI